MSIDFEIYQLLFSLYVNLEVMLTGTKKERVYCETTCTTSILQNMFIPNIHIHGDNTVSSSLDIIYLEEKTTCYAHYSPFLVILLQIKHS